MDDELQVVLEEDEQDKHNASEIFFENEGGLGNRRLIRIKVLSANVVTHFFYNSEEEMLVTDVLFLLLIVLSNFENLSYY